MELVESDASKDTITTQITNQTEQNEPSSDGKTFEEKECKASANLNDDIESEPNVAIAKSIAEEIIKDCRYINEVKNRPLKIVTKIWLLERSGGFPEVDCKDGKEFHEKELDSLISKTTFYRYCAAAEFAYKKSIEVTDGTIKALYAIADVHEKSRDQIWDDSKTADNVLIPKPKRIRELESKRKAKGSKDNVTVESAGNIEPVETAEKPMPSLAVQTIFSKFNSHETLELQNLEAAINQRLHEVESDQFGIQTLTIPELTSLSEMLSLTMQSRHQDIAA